MPALIRIL